MAIAVVPPGLEVPTRPFQAQPSGAVSAPRRAGWSLGHQRRSRTIGGAGLKSSRLGVWVGAAADGLDEDCRCIARQVGAGHEPHFGTDIRARACPLEVRLEHVVAGDLAVQEVPSVPVVPNVAARAADGIRAGGG